MHYLDNAATTAVADAVADVACRVLREHFADVYKRQAPLSPSRPPTLRARRRQPSCSAVSTICPALNIRLSLIHIYDGAFAHDILAPGRHVEKVYTVLLDTPLTQEMICLLYTSRCV